MFNTPILLIAWRRPKHFSKVIDAIRKVQPTKVFVAVDGPRVGKEYMKERELIEETKKVVETKIDWECDVKTLYREKNLGCAKGVSSAITWFFEHVEEGIILEDDISPSSVFFDFCESMLIKYRDEERVFHISGTNTQDRWGVRNADYFFSNFGSIWGWATWRRAWKKYDLNISGWPERKKQILKKFPREYHSEIENRYNLLYNQQIDTWDYQWTFCKLLNNGLSIIPSVNLCLNIGFGNDATHTMNMPKWYTKLNQNHLDTPFREPKTFKVNQAYDVQHLALGKADKNIKFYIYYLVQKLRKKLWTQKK